MYSQNNFFTVKRTGKIIQKVPHEIQKKPVGEKVTQNVNHIFPSDSQPKNPKRDKLSAVQQPLSGIAYGLM